jgi:LEA14-like dessication related protein
VSSLAAALVLAVLLAGCASLDQLIQKPTASFSSMNLTRADLLQSTAVFHFNVNNPNPVNIRANRIHYLLKLNGRNFASGELDHGMTLVAGSTSRLQIPVTVRYSDLFESLSQLWTAKAADYAFTGGFTVGPFTIPFQAHGTFDLPKMPEISLENVRVEELSTSGARLQCRLKMDNPNAFELLMKRLDVNLKLGGVSFGRARALPSGTIAGNSASVVNFGFNLSFTQLGYAAYQLLQGANAAYQMDGALVFDAAGGKEHSIPLDASGRVPFIR